MKLNPHVEAVFCTLFFKYLQRGAVAGADGDAVDKVVYGIRDQIKPTDSLDLLLRRRIVGGRLRLLLYISARVSFVVCCISRNDGSGGIGIGDGGGSCGGLSRFLFAFRRSVSVCVCVVVFARHRHVVDRVVHFVVVVRVSRVVATGARVEQRLVGFVVGFAVADAADAAMRVGVRVQLGRVVVMMLVMIVGSVQMLDVSFNDEKRHNAQQHDQRYEASIDLSSINEILSENSSV
jgi:hypothetical protein